jgi:uncharacterized membrane protein
MKKHFSLILILILGIALRFYHNLDVSLWHDEAFSALLIKYPWQEMMYRIGLDVHPPMYYIFLRFWSYIFGDSLASLRGMSIFFGAASVWAGWALVKEAFKNEKAALWAALLLAVNPFQILKFATEARMYTMGAFFALLAAFFLVKALNAQKELHQGQASGMPNLPQDISLKRRTLVYYLGFTASMVIIIYTHYYLFFTAAALGIYGLLYLFFHHRWNWKKYAYLLASYFLIFVSFLPWLKTFLFQYRQVGAGYWIPPIDRWSIPSIFWDMLLGLGRDVNKTSTRIMLVLATLFALYLFYRFLKKTESFHKWAVAFAALAPFAGALLFALLAKLKGSDSSVFLDRYFLFGSVFFTVILAVWLKEIKIRWLAGLMLLAYVLFNIYTVSYYWKDLDVKTKPGLSKAARLLSANVEPKHKLYVGSSFMFFNLKYYINQYALGEKSGLYSLVSGKSQDREFPRPLLYSGGNTSVSGMPHYAGTAILTDQDLVPDFGKGANPGDTVWLVWTNGFGSNKPETPKNWVQVYEQSYAEVRPWVGTYVYVTEYKVTN